MALIHSVKEFSITSTNFPHSLIGISSIVNFFKFETSTSYFSNSYGSSVTTQNMIFSVMVFNVPMVTFWMTPLMNKFTNIVMDDG